MKRIGNIVIRMNFICLFVVLVAAVAAEENETVTSNSRTGENVSEVSTEPASEKEATTDSDIHITSTEESDPRAFTGQPEENVTEAEESIEKPTEKINDPDPESNQTEKTAATDVKTEKAESRSADKSIEESHLETERIAEEELNGIERTTDRSFAEEPKEIEVPETKSAKDQVASDTRSSDSETIENKSGTASKRSSDASSDVSSISSQFDSANLERLSPAQMTPEVLKKIMAASFNPNIPDISKKMFPDNIGHRPPPFGAKSNDMELFNLGSWRNRPEYIAPPLPQYRPYPPLTPEPSFYHPHSFQPTMPPRSLASGDPLMPYKGFMDNRPTIFDHDVNSNSYPYSPIEPFQRPNFYPPKQFFDPNFGHMKPSRRYDGNPVIPSSFYEYTPGFSKPARGPENNSFMPPTFYDPNQNFPRPSPPTAIHNNYGPKQPSTYNDNFRNRRNADDPTSYRRMYTTSEPNKPNYFGYNFSPKPHYEINNSFPHPIRGFDSNQLIPPTPVYNNYESMKPPTYNDNFRTRRHAEEMNHQSSEVFRRKYPFGTF